MPLFCKLKVCSTADVAGAVTSKLKANGDSSKLGMASAVPLPDNTTSAGLVPLLAICKVALRAPTAAG